MIFLSRYLSHERRFGGGGSSQAQQIESAPVPLPAPPVTANNQAVMQAEHDYAKQQQGQNSVRKSIIAGDTGGYMGASAKPPSGPTGTAPGSI